MLCGFLTQRRGDAELAKLPTLQRARSHGLYMFLGLVRMA